MAPSHSQVVYVLYGLANLLQDVSDTVVLVVDECVSMIGHTYKVHTSLFKSNSSEDRAVFGIYVTVAAIETTWRHTHTYS